MKISKGLEVLQVLNTLGARVHIYPTVIYDKDEVVLIDTGYPGNLQVIKDQMKSANVPMEKLSKVILTHQDFDHMGGVWSILEDIEHPVEVLCHEAEKDYIEGTKTPIKLTPDFMSRVKSMVNNYSFKKQQEVTKILDNYYVKVSKTLVDKDELPICGGIEVIHMPGHTPGHICLYLKKHKTLVAGDALTVTNGELYGPEAQYTEDMKMAIESLEKLKDYNIKTVICYHGGIYQKNPNKRIPEIIKNELKELENK